MLRDYKQFLGRCKYLSALIPELEEEAEHWRSDVHSEVIGIGGQNMDGMPHGGTVGSPTERIGIMLAMGYEPKGLQDLEKEIKAYKEELQHKLVTVHFVEAWLDGLTDKERWIVERQVIDGAYWREVTSEYRHRYGEEYSKEGLKRIKVSAMEKIHRMAA